MLGSPGLITGKDMSVEYTLPDWLEEGTESSLRDSEDDILQIPAYAQGSGPRAISSSSKSASPVVLIPTGSPSPANSTPLGGATSTWTDLDKFYADEEEDEVNEEEESDDETEIDEEDSGADDLDEDEGSGDYDSSSDDREELQQTNSLR
jgi:AP-3 complex subunit beta